MQDHGPLIALVFFVLGTIIFGLAAWGPYDKLYTPAEEGGEESALDLAIRDKQDEKLKKAGEIEMARHELELWRNRTYKAAREKKFFTELKKRYEKELEFRTELRDRGREYGQEAVMLSEKVEESKAKTSRKIREDESKARDDRDRNIDSITKVKNDAAAKLRRASQLHQQVKEDFRNQKNREESELVEAVSQLHDLTARFAERAHISLEVDGRVILSEPLQNLVAINRGTADGVRNGFRFECFSLRPGNRKVHKAYIEVRRAKKNISECFVIRKKVEMPTDPLSGYVAKQPEEMYSPRVHGENGAQSLSGQPKIVETGAPSTDPIVAGDLIRNPFYSPGRTYTFYIAGNKTIEHGLQKSAVRYTWRHIADVVRRYGGRVVEKVDADVNFIIAQRNAVPTDARQRGQGDVYDKEALRGIALGVPVIYEWELFRFLEDR